MPDRPQQQPLLPWVPNPAHFEVVEGLPGEPRPSSSKAAPPQRSSKASEKRGAYKRHDDPKAHALWLGRANGPNTTRLVLTNCPTCWAEQAVEPCNVWPAKSEWIITIARDERGEMRLRTDEPVISWKAAAKCLQCGAGIALTIIGSLEESWDLGAGVIRAMPNFPEAQDGPCTTASGISNTPKASVGAEVAGAGAEGGP